MGAHPSTLASCPRTCRRRPPSSLPQRTPPSLKLIQGCASRCRPSRPAPSWQRHPPWRSPLAAPLPPLRTPRPLCCCLAESPRFRTWRSGRLLPPRPLPRGSAQQRPGRWQPWAPAPQLPLQPRLAHWAPWVAGPPVGWTAGCRWCGWRGGCLQRKQQQQAARRVQAQPWWAEIATITFTNLPSQQCDLVCKPTAHSHDRPTAAPTFIVGAHAGGQVPHLREAGASGYHRRRTRRLGAAAEGSSRR